jgi:hypothetical protein
MEEAKDPQNAQIHDANVEEEQVIVIGAQMFPH